MENKSDKKTVTVPGNTGRGMAPEGKVGTAYLNLNGHEGNSDVI